jgi:protein TonB
MTNEGALPQQREQGRPGLDASHRGRPLLSAAAAILLHVGIGAALIVATDRPEAPEVPDIQTVAMVFAAPVQAEPATQEPAPEPALAPAPPDTPSTPEAPPPAKTAADAPPRRQTVAAPRKAPPARTVATPAVAPNAAPIAQSVAEPEPVIATDWKLSFGSWLEAHKSYPYEARRRGTEGRVGLRFTVERSGRVTDVAVVSSAGSLILDDAAAALIRNARLPPFTPGMPQAQVTITWQISYALTN